MPAKSQVLEFLMRYRKGMPLEDLGVEFCVHVATGIKIIENLMYKEVKYPLHFESYQAQEIQQ